MVSAKEIRASNSSLKSQSTSQNYVAVFVGATAGIGLSTIRQLAIHIASPKVYIIGRSQSKFASTLQEIQALNSKATIIFLEAQISLLKDVDRVCEEIKAKEEKLALLWVSSGFLSFTNPEDTPEGLPPHLTVTYYARLRFVSNLMPILTAAESPRVVSVLAAGKEAKLLTEDLALQQPGHYSLPQSANHSGTMMSLAFAYLAPSNPKVSFVHYYPGLVDTGLLGNLFGTGKGWTSYLIASLGWLLRPVVRLFSLSLDEAGERGLYAATSERFATGGKQYRLDWNQEDAPKVQVYDEYLADGTDRTVWEHTEAMFEKATAN